MTKEIKLSYSSVDKFGSCPKSWQIHYVDKLRGIAMPSPFLYGKSMDNALNYMLANFKTSNKEECVKESKAIFDSNWKEQNDNFGELVQLSHNVNIEYSPYDFEHELFSKKMWAQLFGFNSEAFISRKNAIDNPTTASDFDKQTANYMAWLSLGQKAHLHIDAYYENFIPQFEEIYSIQTEFNVSDGDGGRLNGFLDFVAKLKDGRVAVLDNKTSSVEYAASSVSDSIQLAIYMKMIEILKESGQYLGPLPTHAGYCVLSKKLDKKTTKTCTVCGKVAKTNKVKTCDAKTKGTKDRCGGTFDKVVLITVPTQFIVDQVPEHMIQLTLENIDEVKKCIQHGVFPRNFSSCVNKYKKTCVYEGLCKRGDMTGLAYVKEKK